MSNKRKRKSKFKPCLFCGRPEKMRPTPGRVWIGMYVDQIFATSPVCNDCVEMHRLRLPKGDKPVPGGWQIVGLPGGITGGHPSVAASFVHAQDQIKLLKEI